MQQRFIRPVAFGAVPSDVDLANVRAVLEGPEHVLFPVADDVPQRDSPDIATGLQPDEDDQSDPTVLAIATSGSSGGPKIVLLSEQALRASGAATEHRMGGPGQWLLCLSLTHIAGIQVVLRSHLAGTTPVVCSPGGPDFAADFSAATESLSQERRYVSLVPTQLRRLLELVPHAAASFDGILLGGAAADPDLLDRAAEAGCTVITTYGMSETAGGCVYDGVALQGVKAAIDETTGQISLTGPVVARGYLGGDLFGAQTFRTQDAGEIIDGRLVVYGRLDDIIITGGEKVAPVTVENALRQLGQIRDVAVIGIQDATWGQCVLALVVGDSPLDPADIRSRVSTLLPRAAVPRRIIQVRQIPRIGIGKLDRAAAARLAC